MLDIIGNVVYYRVMKKIKDKQRPHRLTLRIPQTLNEDLVKAAAREGIPLNQYCIYLLSKNLEKEKRHGRDI